MLSFQTRILWIDQQNLLAHCECGIIGQDLERRVCMCVRVCACAYVCLYRKRLLTEEMW